MSGKHAVDCYESLDEQVALVTGATRGIGATIASDLTDLGATVYAGARDTDDITEPDQRAIRLDVTDESEIETAIDRIADEVGQLDILVNNAGVFYRSGPLHEMSTDEFDHTLEVNLRGPTLVTKHALPLLLKQDGARVVSLSSNLGQFSQGQMGGGYPPYRISKVGLGGLTAYLHAEYASEGLIASAVSPGWVRTDMGGSNANRSPKEGADTPVWLSRFKPGSVGGRLWRDRTLVEW
ncbi:SDR family NAD(P)-dependent oxidoreductase [Salinigranum halophilum]|uniref:SDR family NAD(P)-dependent oxidoreductase n=1 Tax=Salinigranum halophilum TaxID=2565931 RepID=UPI0010A81370|nr:SDR family NAD(P)-dependent oxidoreductase [Salinigranum halophilum]